jgi:glucokinase
MKNMPNSPFVLTADVGGSHITTAICNIEENVILDETIARVDVSSQDTAEHIFGAWETSLQHSLNSAGHAISGLGIAMPGPFDYDNGISYITGLNKFDAIYEVDVKQKLAEIINIDPAAIQFRNDAEAAVAGEVWANFGKEYQNIIGVTLGTGFGSAHYINGITKDVSWGSEPFKDSIADDYMSTRWFLRRYYALTGKKVNEVKDLYLMAPYDTKVAGIFHEFGQNLGYFLSKKIDELNPELLILCGNITRSSDLFLSVLRGASCRFLFSWPGLAKMPLCLA